MPEREKKLIAKGSPCIINYFDKNLLTYQQTVKRGEDYCPNIPLCEKAGIYCAFNIGLQLAQHLAQGKCLEDELIILTQQKFITGEFWNSVNRREFRRERGAGKFIRAAEGFARVVLLQDAFTSTLPSCEKCDSAKIPYDVYDSIHDGPFPLSGSGRTRKRRVCYCPECESTPIGDIIKEDPDENDPVLKKLRKRR